MLVPKPGKQNAQKLRRQAADLAVPPTTWFYTPPPESECTPHNYPVHLDDAGTVQFVYAFLEYKGKAVHFSVELYVREFPHDDWSVVYRVDTSHGTVHEHLFRPGGANDESEQLERKELAPIPRDGAWEFVDGWLEKAIGSVDETWEAHVRRWRS